ncbi:hypothetical protein Q0590_21295 [Rhodocytophaga aerolata]|uniref:Uncharacterized protein n=1 Tax=Rhodocytophaga aerolata TaxID=455078 RepID=A0ABT8RDJ9_9BACT|nr:hypothetical protein [Rhodocytophaga aerolata]MDO1448827.1 hypothetical protein [Rhodocytophaga aerolata]
MKIILLVSILIIYFPVLYLFKRKIIRTMGTEEVPAHLRWYEGAGYLIKHSHDDSKVEKLTQLQNQIRMASITGILLFWAVVLFF